MKKIVGKNILDAFVCISPFLNDLTSQDMFISVCDTEKILAYEPAHTFNLGIKVGEVIKEGTAARKTLLEKTDSVMTVPREVFGVAYKIYSTPVFDEENRIIGVVGIGASLENQQKLQNIIQQFSSAFQEITSSIQEITQGSQNLAKIGQALSQIAHQAREDVKKTDDIIEIMNHVSDQTNLLGLNAAIEAARAGESGRGFSVVAEEIRSLSIQSKTSAKEVAKTLREIAGLIESISNETQETNAISEEQAASTEEVAAAMEELLAQLDTLNEFVNII